MFSLREFNHAVMRSLPHSMRQRLISGSLEYIHETTYESIRRRGFRPHGIIDIGANQGTWAGTITRYFPGAPILMIEPLDEQRDALERMAEQVNGKAVMALLGAENGRSTDFWVMGTGSSVYSENTDAPRTLRPLIMRTLDSIMAENESISAPLFIKIDAQGSELDILRGAKQTLPSTELIQLEISLVQYNAGAPTAYEVFEFMDAAGFSIFEISGVGRKSGYLVQLDVVFVKTSSELRKYRF